MNYLCGFTRGLIHCCNSIPTGMFYERKYDAIIVLLLKMNVFLYNWRPHNTVRVQSIMASVILMLSACTE